MTWGFLPDDRATVKTGITDKTVAEVLAGKQPPDRKPDFYTLEAYKETPIFIPLDIMEYVVKSVAQKRLGSAGPGGIDSEALHGWILRNWENLY